MLVRQNHLMERTCCCHPLVAWFARPSYTRIF
uniref:Uncharacterized protein n=1 Tax=Anguilla anguilla TaxID=7936 RepID=A0A0E9U3M0_ANGAN